MTEATATTTGTAIHRRVRACRDAEDPTLIGRLSSGWVVLGDPQVLRGYCLLLPDPVVPHLNAMDASAQGAFLADVARLGDAVLAVTDALRINYAIFGNLEPALHAHVFPRYANEPESLRTANPWAYDWSQAPRFDVARDGALIARLRAALIRP
jgi:diadenosine tetraphosphate (Ap4A) HIT family hydrolase